MPKNGSREASYVWELIHPSGEWEGLPALIGVGTTDPPWLRRWELRHWCGSRAAEWFRSLESRGLEPTPSKTWLPGAALRLPEAIRLANIRLEQVREWAGCRTPAWLLHEDRDSRTPRPVSCIRDGVEVERYRSINVAARARGVCPPSVWWWLYSGCADSNGCRWVDARTCN